jgi:polysaccharide export outer membrane protein
MPQSAMFQSISSVLRRLTAPVARAATVAIIVATGMLPVLPAARASAQVPDGNFPGGLPSPEQARVLLSQPGMADQLRQRIATSGLSPDEIRARLRAAGYPESMLDEFLGPAAAGGATSGPAPQTLDAARALGILSVAEAESLRVADSLTVISDSLRRQLALRADSARVDSLTDSLRALRSGGLKLFGLETFRRTSSAFQATQAGPVDENYRLGPGDVLVLILTGDVEQAHTLEVNREGFVIIPQVGQVFVANLTLAQLEQQLYSRLGRVYSGVRRGANATTKFQLSIARLRNVQVHVIGDVVRPGAYQISAAGTVLTALYAAGGPTEGGSFRRIEIRRGDKLIDSIDVYDYLLRGYNRSDVRLQSGDVVFVPVHGGYVKVAGKVTRPAVYELLPRETLRDVIGFAGGFEPTARQTRAQIQRVLPPDARGDGRPARVVLDVGADQFANGVTPAVPMAPGDSVTIFGVAERVRSFVTVRGNVWVEGRVGLAPGMKLSDAIKLAGGPKPDVYLREILVARRREDSTLVQLRSAFADSTGQVTDDLVLEDQDEVTVFASSRFRELPYVSIVGAVRQSGRVQYREGMTLRDAILLAGGVTQDADLGEAEIARRTRDGTPGTLATTLRVPLDSSYTFSGPAGVRTPDTPLEPFDNVLILRQTGWDVGRLVHLTGQVKHPGRYTLRSKTERLADLVERAGGLTPEAYAGGVQFYRVSPLVSQRPDAQVPAPIAEGRRTARPGLTERVGIDLPRVLRDPEFRDNVILAAGDSVHIPEYTPIIMVQGAVNAPGAVAYSPGKSLDWYVDAAGGYTQTGDHRRTYVTQPDGRRESVKRRVVWADYVPAPRPGAVVVVPVRVAQESGGGVNVAGILSTAAQLLGALVTIIVVSKSD